MDAELPVTGSSSAVLSLLQRVHVDTPPLNPDGPTAQQWLQHELAKPEYQAAKPTWFDRLAQQISEWFSALGSGIGGNAAWIMAGIGVALLAAVLIAAFVIFGMPRLSRRRQAPAVFDAQDHRSADELRRRAASAASAGRYDEAVRELFRAIGRALGDRTIVLVLPGTTAQELAIEASGALPAFTTQLHGAATLFDGVRYLGRRADADDYATLAALDRELAKARPVFTTADAVVTE
ncbi:DUF4129 domain-containing protein [Planctomonas sp. JC2975]|uniref:DUF4129 domain-containing protein n=1 Tax=Planctomonas sp. JC2975 TaxID=2729626 RepID=UPI00147389F6|nr:DUF4129 domain-containing protein [Planctomonas sp. JC2975]NNC13108.1 DUF4129 domain-containing protein [Planctomonas sp. JC2975]